MFLEPSHKPEVFFTDTSLKFVKSCEGLAWNHRTAPPHRSETNGIAENAVRRVKEGTSAVLLQSGLDERWWAGSMECYCYLRNIQDLLRDGETPYERRFGALIEYHPISPKDPSRVHQFGSRVLLGFLLGYELIAGGIWKGDIMWLQFGKIWKTCTHQKLSSKNQRERRIDNTKKKMNSYSQ